MKLLEFLAQYGVLVLCLIFWTVILGGMVYRVIIPKYRKTVKVKAKVIDKYQSDNMVYDFVNRRGTVKRDYYTVCFDIDGGIKKFNVSPLAYNYLEKGMKGTLSYKGNTYIDFD